MNVFSLTITYRDGETRDLETGQYAISEAERWGARNGVKFDMAKPDELAFTQLRVIAWAEDVRDLPVRERPDYDDWSTGVDDVSPRKGRKKADPTQPATSAG